MAHLTSLERKEGMYVLSCTECGEITRQPANRGGLLARGQRHEQNPEGKSRVERSLEAVRTRISSPERPERALPALPSALHGHAYERANICGKCGGPLRDSRGVSRMTVDGQGFPLPVCEGCVKIKVA
jgi:hypothetical protein